MIDFISASTPIGFITRLRQHLASTMYSLFKSSGSISALYEDVIITMIDKGYTRNEIARKLKVHRETLREFIKTIS